MEQPTNQQPSPEMAPPPRSGEQQPLNVPEKQPAKEPTPEKKAGSTEGAVQNSGMVLPPVTDQTAPPPVVDQPPSATQKPAKIGDTPAVADDTDVIEKEWVDKAKDIVDKTKDNPHEQNKQVSVLKADYMKKRYGKDIRLTED